ncbi:CpaF family protein, partial [Streptomyces sp. NPDC002589]
MTDTRPESSAANDLQALFTRALDESAPVPAPVLRPVPAQASPTRVPDSAFAAQGAFGPGMLPVGHEVLAELRSRASMKIGEAAGADASMSEQDRRQHGQSVITHVVSAWATKYAASVRELTAEEERAVREAVYDELFRAGRLQPLLDDPNVENIIIYGDKVRVDYADRPSRSWDPIAQTDRDLINLVNHLARMQGQGECALTPATPNLNMRLADGSRLAASAWVTPRPSIVIRRHRTRGQGLDDLVGWGTIDPTLAHFLRAAVKGRKNVIVVGRGASTARCEPGSPHDPKPRNPAQPKLR